MTSFFRMASAKVSKVVGGDDEGAGSADDVVAIVVLEVGLEREDRQAVDADAGAHRLVARLGHRAAAVVAAVARNVDHAPRAA